MIWLQACFVVFMGILFSTLNIAYLLMRYMMIKIALSGYVKDCTNDLFAYAYSFNDNSFDEVIANDVIASNAPHFENEISSKFLTRSGYENSIQSSLTENQMRLLGEILQMSEKKDFTFACAFDLVKRSELSEEEAQAMYAFVAITSGIVDALQNANPMMTRAIVGSALMSEVIGC